jgi:serine O-acetyltransferase|tara:strand:+ start:1198 stop:1923 length:726 start_codon:yes stop_codon:yes gene_type:complete
MNSIIWNDIKKEIALRIDAEPSLKDYLESLILSKENIIEATAAILGSKLNNDALSSIDLYQIILAAFNEDDVIQESLINDILFFRENDPACKYLSTPLLFYKGFQGLAAYRASNILWNDDRHTMALYIQNRSSEVFGVDIHPAATIDSPVMIDHATGVVIGETAKIKKNVSIFQGVTLGGNSFTQEDRHPKIEEGVSIYASSTILGNVNVGSNSIIAAGSLVLDDVAENSTVAGIPAKKIK